MQPLRALILAVIISSVSCFISPLLTKKQSFFFKDGLSSSVALCAAVDYSGYKLTELKTMLKERDQKGETERMNVPIESLIGWLNKCK